MIAVGVDTHKHEHAVCVLDDVGQLIGERTIGASSSDYAQLVVWLRAFAGELVVGIEGVGSYGAGLCEYLLDDGMRVVEVARPRRRDRRRGKSDQIDALLAARHVLAGDGLSTPRTGGTRLALQALLGSYRSTVGERTRVLNELLALHTIAPLALHERIGAGSGKQLARRVLTLRARPGAAQTERLILELMRDLARRAGDLTRRAERYRRQLDELVRSLDDALLRERGVGPISAAKLLVCDPRRLKSKPRLPAATAPLRNRRRLARRSATASLAAATAKRTTRSTRSRSAAPSTTPPPAPTSNDASAKAKPAAKRCAASNASSLGSSTNVSSPLT